MAKQNVSRRVLLQGAAATSGAPVPGGTPKDNAESTAPVPLAEPDQRKSGSGYRGCIDVHHHVLPPDYVRQIGNPAIGAPAGKSGPPPWSVAASLEVMDRLGIETAVTSVSAPGFPLNDMQAVQRLVRTCNIFSKQMMVDYPHRFGMFATLPLPDIAASLAEVRYAYEELSADGIILYTNYRDVYLGDTHLAPLMEELNRRQAVVFVHPTVCQCSLGVQPGIPMGLIEFPHDTSRTIVSMLFHGTFKNYPDIRFIFSHAGGTVPFLINRIGLLMPQLGPDGPLPYLKRQYFDLAASANPQAMGPLLGMVDVSQVLVGTDYPFAPPEGVRAAVEGVAELSLDPDSIRRVQRENALHLFPRFDS